MTRWVLVWCSLLMVGISGCGPQEGRPLPRQRDPEPITFEFLLPVRAIPDQVSVHFHPWIKQFIGKSPEQAKELLKERWKELREPALIGLRDKLLAMYEARAISIYGERAFIQLRKRGADGEGPGNHWYIPPPVEEPVITERLREAKLEGNVMLSSFLRAFAGMRDIPPPTYGDFVLPGKEPIPVLDDNYDLTMRGSEKWKGSLLFYHVTSGNAVLIHSSGRVGWWDFAEDYIEQEAESVEAFIRKFTDLLGTEYLYY